MTSCEKASGILWRVVGICWIMMFLSLSFCPLNRWKPPVSPLVALCTFLIAEKFGQEKSRWKPYLDLLPETYTCPVCLEHETVDLLPEPLRGKAHEQRRLVQELFLSSQPFFFSLQPLFLKNLKSVFNYHAFQWAWCTINTRTVYMKHPQRGCFSRDPDTYALAPFLDLLNHNPAVQVGQIQVRLLVCMGERQSDVRMNTWVLQQNVAVKVVLV